MKAVILAVLVLLVVSHGDALRCNCGGSRRCTSRVETCAGSNMVCIRATIHAGPVINSFKGCFRESDCKMLSRSGTASVYCCKRDLCN